jgi:hypothetical protein
LLGAKPDSRLARVESRGQIGWKDFKLDHVRIDKPIIGHVLDLLDPIISRLWIVLE